MLPEGVEPEVWRLAGGDRIAFENYSDLLTARHFRQSVLCRAGEALLGTEPEPERAQRLHWAVRPKAEPLEVGLVADAFAELDRRRPQAVGFAELRDALDADPRRARRGADRRLPARAPDPARRPAARRERSRRAPGRLAARPLAGGAGPGPHVARLHDRPHGGAGRPAADHAARRHARPRGDPRRAAGARRPRAERRATSTRTSSSSPACSCWSRPTRNSNVAARRSIPAREVGPGPGSKTGPRASCALSSGAAPCAGR